MMHTSEFFESHAWIIVFHVKGSLGIVSQLVFFVFSHLKIFFLHPETDIPIIFFFFPLLEPFHTFVWMHEVLLFHLFKFSCAIGKVSWCDFISKCFSHLCNTKRNLLSHRSLHIQKIHIDTLCCFWTQENITSLSLDDPHLCFEHEVKLANIGQVSSTFRTCYFCVEPRTWSKIRFDSFCFEKMICTKTLVTFFAVNKWIGKSIDMPTGLPDGGVHQDC